MMTAERDGEALLQYMQEQRAEVYARYIRGSSVPGITFTLGNWPQHERIIAAFKAMPVPQSMDFLFHLLLGTFPFPDLDQILADQDAREDAA
jgi:hypothetical protein